MIKAVIFDLDDTLYPESGYIKSGFLSVGKHTGIENAAKTMEELFEKSHEGVFDRFSDICGKNIDPKELHNIYINHFPEISLYDDSLDCLERLKKAGYKLGLITDGRPVQQNNKIDALCIRDYFDAVILSDGFGTEYRKPHIKPFEEMKNKLGAKYGEMIYIGDNPAKDFFISALTDTKTVQILRRGFYGGAYYKDAAPDFVIGNLYEIENIISEIDKKIDNLL